MVEERSEKKLAIGGADCVRYHPRQLGDLPVTLHFVTMVAKRQLLAICLLQPLLGRNARGFRRDASG